MRLLGAVLAGGRSTRFGSDKALALLDGKALLDHAIDSLIPHVETVMVCGRPWRDLAWAVDLPRPHLGPLGGVNAALHHAQAHGFDAILTLACDVPFVPNEIVEALVATSAAAYCGDIPVIAKWPAELAVSLDKFLAFETNHSIRRWGQAVEAVCINSASQVVNINTLVDLAEFNLRS